MFFQLNTDHTKRPIALQHSFSSAFGSACWLVGGGCSLSALDCEAIAKSPLPVMTINLAGTRLIRPNFWTSYDPSLRFHRSVYLDASVMKFVHQRRAMEFVPETTFKVCECPNLYFFERDSQRGFADFVSVNHRKIVDWSDSFVQAMDLLFQLGFRTIYLAGCEMFVAPATRQQQAAEDVGVSYQQAEPLRDWMKRCERAGLSAADLDEVSAVDMYHFHETKPLRSVVQSDYHYYRIVQMLRLSRQAMASAGLKLVSVTPTSRLNDFFPHESVEDVLLSVKKTIGNPQTEAVTGLYRQRESRLPELLCPMKDFTPPGQQKQQPLPKNSPALPETDGEFLVEAEGLVK